MIRREVIRYQWSASSARGTFPAKFFCSGHSRRDESYQRRIQCRLALGIRAIEITRVWRQNARIFFNPFFLGFLLVEMSLSVARLELESAAAALSPDAAFPG
jgi:hypothetical protein